MFLTEYETTLVVRPDVAGDVIETTLDRVREVIKGGSGKLLAISHWGKKKLAFEIEKHSRGIYVHTHFLGDNKLVAELERNLRISDHVMRYMTIRLAQGVSVDSREEKAYVKPQYDLDDGSLDEGPDFSAEETYSSGRDRDRDHPRGDRDDDDRGRDRDRREDDREPTSGRDGDRERPRTEEGR